MKKNYDLIVKSCKKYFNESGLYSKIENQIQKWNLKMKNKNKTLILDSVFFLSIISLIDCFYKILNLNYNFIFSFLLFGLCCIFLNEFGIKRR